MNPVNGDIYRKSEAEILRGHIRPGHIDLTVEEYDYLSHIRKMERVSRLAAFRKNAPRCPYETPHQRRVRLLTGEPR